MVLGQEKKSYLLRVNYVPGINIYILNSKCVHFLPSYLSLSLLDLVTAGAGGEK